MIESIGNLIRYIVILIFLATLLEMILPHGQFRRYLRMLVGILLILTIISPIQSIMRLAPGWEIPVYLAAPSSQDELAFILHRGEQMREESYQKAVDNYKYRLFTVVDNLLAREFAAELVELQVTLDEDPDSNEFGAIKNILVVARKKKSIPVSSSNNDPVKEIRISIERGENEETHKMRKDDEANAGSSGIEEEAAFTGCLANYFLLNDEQVEVKFIP